MYRVKFFLSTFIPQGTAPLDIQRRRTARSLKDAAIQEFEALPYVTGVKELSSRGYQGGGPGLVVYFDPEKVFVEEDRVKEARTSSFGDLKRKESEAKLQAFREFLGLTTWRVALATVHLSGHWWAAGKPFRGKGVGKKVTPSFSSRVELIDYLYTHKEEIKATLEKEFGPRPKRESAHIPQSLKKAHLTQWRKKLKHFMPISKEIDKAIDDLIGDSAARSVPSSGGAPDPSGLHEGAACTKPNRASISASPGQPQGVEVRALINKLLETVQSDYIRYVFHNEYDLDKAIGSLEKYGLGSSEGFRRSEAPGFNLEISPDWDIIDVREILKYFGGVEVVV